MAIPPALSSEIQKVNRLRVADKVAENVCVYYLETPVGLLEIQATEQGVASINFVGEQAFDVSENAHILLAIQQLNSYFEGKTTAFSFPLHLHGTPFQERVWRKLLEIPFGKTWSYLDLAKALGDAKLTRAVGLANGSNKIAIVVPCHRVIGTQGALVGYAGGLARKKWLLDLENPPMQTSLF
jgi:methylated-DNA-[protein]-cysteine S-methyltransferase